MAPKTCLDNEKYMTEQSAEILRRVEQFGDRLTLSSGASLYDYHASRVLPI